MIKKSFYIILAILLNPNLALAADLKLDGSTLSAIWVIPFVGILLSIAIFPLLLPHFWHKNYGKVSLAWCFAFILPAIWVFGGASTLYALLDSIIEEYIPFIVLLGALFVITGGIRLTGNLVGTPKLNTVILLIGTILASFMGTTGSAMLFIRPLLRANAHRKYKVHTVIFFIFLVANIGGSLTPLGDPPLFLGFLQGVGFFWTLEHLFVKTAFVSCILLCLYFAIDSYYYSKETNLPKNKESNEKLGVEGGINFLFLFGVVFFVLLSGVLKIDYSLVVWQDIAVKLPDLIREIGLIALAGLSLYFTSKAVRERNDFNWEPILEVAKIFIGIFITMIPAIAILKAGESGALKNVVSLVTNQNGEPNNIMYFWLTGLLSSFLDNAPTYLVFFNTAGGDAQLLMGDLKNTLIAISAGSVFMGACTYIGNAPNFMIKSIADSQGVKMPSFFSYMLWPIFILLPLFFLVSILFLK